MDEHRSTRYDAIVIGSGQAGNPLSLALANAGRKTALVERAHIGGTCINEGCTPTKTMIASARVAHLVSRAEDYGIHARNAELDLSAIRRRKRDIVHQFRSGSERRLEETDGLDIFFGEAEFMSGHEVRIRSKDDDLRLNSELIIINTGTRPRVPNLAGLDTIPYLTSSTIMELDQVPERLLVLGGGYVGVEFAQMFQRFGSQVTLVQRRTHLLPREDEDVSLEIEALLHGEGVALVLNADTQSISLSAEGTVELDIKTNQGHRTLSGTHFLAAVGRLPNTEALCLDTSRVERDERGFIRVNAQLETTAPGIFALGDVNGGPAFTHVAYDDYRIVWDHIAGSKIRSTNDRHTPYVVYTDPQLGRIGLSETEARAQGLQFRVARIPMNYVARALETDESRGFVKAIVDASTDQILGATVFGIEGGELMGAIQIAMMGQLPYPVLRDAVFAHPSLIESLNTLFSSFVDP